MIRLVIDNFGGRADIRVNFVCPYCGRVTWFAAYAPFQCEACHSVLPNISSMLMDEDERLLYHREGRTKFVDRQLSKSNRWRIPKQMVFDDSPEEYIRKCIFSM